MLKACIGTALAGVVAIAMSTAAISTPAMAAAMGQFDNMCAEGLVLGKKVQTDCSVNETIGGKLYCFGNDQAKTDFMKDPQGNLTKAEANYSKMESE